MITAEERISELEYISQNSQQEPERPKKKKKKKI